MRIIFFTLFACCYICSLNAQKIYGGTTILIMADSNTIYMAADSKLVPSMNFAEDSSTVDTVDCKLIAAKNIVVGTAGNFSISYSRNHKEFDNASLALHSIQVSNTFEETMDYFIDSNRKFLQPLFKSIAYRLPNVFDSILAKKQLSETLFATIKNGKTYIISVSFHLTGTKRHWIIDTRINEHETKKMTVFTIGFGEEIKKAVESGNYEKGYIGDVMQNLIKLEIKANPKFVGEPIDVIRVKNDGTIWLTPKRSCN